MKNLTLGHLTWAGEPSARSSFLPLGGERRGLPAGVGDGLAIKINIDAGEGGKINRKLNIFDLFYWPKYSAHVLLDFPDPKTDQPCTLFILEFIKKR